MTMSVGEARKQLGKGAGVTLVVMTEQQYRRFEASMKRHVERVLKPGARRRVMTARAWSKAIGKDPKTIRRWAADPANLAWAVVANEGREKLIRGPEGLA